MMEYWHKSTWANTSNLPEQPAEGIMSPTLVDTLFLNNLPSTNTLTKKKKNQNTREYNEMFNILPENWKYMKPM